MSSPSRPLDTTPPDPWDAAGKWLAAHHQLTNQERDQVKAALSRGRRLSDPRLQEAVCGLASEILANRMRTPGIVAQYVTGTVSDIMALAFVLSSPSGHGHHGIIAITAVGLAVHNAFFCFVFTQRQLRKKIAKALRVNSGIEEPPAP